MKVTSPLELYKFLPQTNCAECGETTCMAFASKLIEREYNAEDCPPLVTDAQYADRHEAMVAALSPEVRAVVIGTGENAVTVGGEDVLFRHQLTYYNPTALAYDVTDTMDEDTLKSRVGAVNDFKKFYVGHYINVDMVAVRCTSNDAGRFADTVGMVCSLTDKPLILCSFDFGCLRAGAEACAERRPLLYAATKDNWQDVMGLAQNLNLPVVLFSPGDLDGLKSMAATFSRNGVSDIILDPGTYPEAQGLQATFQSFLKLRRAAMTEGQDELRYPLMAVPMTSWLSDSDPVESAYWETMVAATLMVKNADIEILHSLEPYSVIPLVTLRENLYTDPRTPVQVDAGVVKVNEPDENSPVFMTTNFALTFYTVQSDLESSGIDCYLVVVDTEGIGVQAAVAGSKLTTGNIFETIEGYEPDVRKVTKHNTLVIPGLAARLQGELEEASGMKVLVGPQDSGRIKGWLEDNWPAKK